MAMMGPATTHGMDIEGGRIRGNGMVGLSADDGAKA